MSEVITTVTKLLEYDDNSYYAIDYTGAMQQLNESLNTLITQQAVIICLIACLIALIAVVVFALAYKHKNY